jgi:hypothetical protein
MRIYFFKIEKNSSDIDVPVLDGFQIIGTESSQDTDSISRFSYNVETKELIRINWTSLYDAADGPA